MADAAVGSGMAPPSTHATTNGSAPGQLPRRGGQLVAESCEPLELVHGLPGDEPDAPRHAGQGPDLARRKARLARETDGDEAVAEAGARHLEDGPERLDGDERPREELGVVRAKERVHRPPGGGGRL